MVWKQLVGQKLSLEDLADVDRGFVSKYSYLSALDGGQQPGYIYDAEVQNKELAADDIGNLKSFELPFTIHSATGSDIKLSSNQYIVNESNRLEYLRLALHARLHEFDLQVNAVRAGMSQVIPVPILALFTGAELESMVCGSPEIPVESFKSITTYNNIDPHAPLVQWFWEILAEFTNQERSLFLRFVWGRTRLPRSSIDFRGKDFIFQVGFLYTIQTKID